MSETINNLRREVKALRRQASPQAAEAARSLVVKANGYENLMVGALIDAHILLVFDKIWREGASA